MLSLPKREKEDLFNVLRKESNAFGQNTTDLSYLPFLNSIWNLRSMPSLDPRFTNAYDDIKQHTINNDDWDEDFLFFDRLKLLEDDDSYNKFVEATVSPKIRLNEDEIIKFTLTILPYIQKYGFTLGVSDTVNDLPVYKIQSGLANENVPLDIKKNTIPFFVVTQPTGRSDHYSSHNTPSVFPSFVLVFNSGWNDYQARTYFDLFYYNSKSDSSKIGPIKIIHKNIYVTSDVISDKFTNLDEEYCSLGQTIDYYKNLKKVSKNNLNGILFALRDTAFFPDIHEEFERHSLFINSLLRNDNAERIIRQAKYEVYGYDLSNLYSFKYLFRPKYSIQDVEVSFDFQNEDVTKNNVLNVPNRIFALIGENGTGKTQLITSLPISISKKEDSKFIPRAPLFSKVIAVSYSIFDKFELPQKTSSFNYIYCGLRNETESISEKGLVLRFHASWRKIEKIERVDRWRSILSNFINDSLLDEFLQMKEPEEITSPSNSYKFKLEEFSKVRRKLSSGQNIVLYIMSEIIAHIRYDSLLLFDEPETHLHPNAISQLMNTIYELVEEFKSYCIIATHSPLIIRELLSKNVFVLDRENEIVAVRRIGLESFGENLTTLTDEVFGNKEVPKQYKKIIRALVTQGKSYEEIVSLLQSDFAPLSLNTRVFIKSQTVKNG